MLSKKGPVIRHFLVACLPVFTCELQYRNECEMLKASCERNMAVTFLHHGPCGGKKENFGGK